MRHLMVCISGWAGVGKDELAGRLVKLHGAIHTGLADPGKRHMKDAYGFSNEQLWGPSEFRNAGDLRYPKPMGRVLKRFDGTHRDVTDVKDEKGKLYLAGYEGDLWYYDVSNTTKLSTNKPYQVRGAGVRFFVREGDPDFWLSPREVLQKYMELLNTLYADTWIRKGIEDHRALASGKFLYDRATGLTKNVGFVHNDLAMPVTCYSDFRHIHEHRLAREAADGTLVPVLIRIKRPTVTKPPFDHRSETEQTRIRDAAYDFVIENNTTLENLYQTMDAIINICSNPGWKGKSWDQAFVLPALQDTYVS